MNDIVISSGASLFRDAHAPEQRKRRPPENDNIQAGICRSTPVSIVIPAAVLRHVLAAKPSQALDIEHRDHPICYLDQPAR